MSTNFVFLAFLWNLVSVVAFLGHSLQFTKLQRGKKTYHPFSPSNESSQTELTTVATRISIDGQHDKTRIRSIRSRNLAGLVGWDSSNGEIVVENFDKGALIAITGETGTGKSLLFAKTIELLTGVKAPSSLLLDDASETTFCEISLILSEPHLASLLHVFQQTGLDSSDLLRTKTLCLRRNLMPGTAGRVKSDCRVNGQKVSLKRLASISSPLMTVVDASAAAMALSKPQARLSLLDASVEKPLLINVQRTGAQYRKCRKERISIEAELASLDFDPVDDRELLEHWINELDAFATRVTQFCRKCMADNDENGQDSLSRNLRKVEWSTNQASGRHRVFVSAMHEILKSLQGELRLMDQKMVSVQNAIDALSMLSDKGSALSALANARRLISDTQGNEKYEDSQERTHELLNQIESALLACTRFMEDDPSGLLQVAEQERSRYPIAVDSLDEILAEWGTLARKHGVLPTALPIRHAALKHERDGSIGAAERLPIALKAENDALALFESACTQLRKARNEVARNIVDQVNQRLPSLGMESSTLCIFVSKVRSCQDLAEYESSPMLSCDAVDLMLEKKRDTNRRGRVDDSASSGEKARLLLALECASPGAISAMTKTASSFDIDFNVENAITVFDEIDAHVGGRAAVAVAYMLAEQVDKSQILAITHSPSVAAIADSHLVVRKTDCSDSLSKVSVCKVFGEQRQSELARMTSGDVAPEEAVAFAEALMRDIIKNQPTAHSAPNL